MPKNLIASAFFLPRQILKNIYAEALPTAEANFKRCLKTENQKQGLYFSQIFIFCILHGKITCLSWKNCLLYTMLLFSGCLTLSKSDLVLSLK